MKNEGAVDYRFRILYAVGIIMVVFGHANGGGISILKDWFPYEGIHLALFMFCSGYFYKKTNEEELPRYFRKKLRTLIIPLYGYTAAYGLIVQALKLKGFEMGGELTLHNLLVAPIMDGHQFVYNLGGWFVVPLFMVESAAVLFRRAARVFGARTSEWLLFAVSVAVGLLGNWLACRGYCWNWWVALVRATYFVPFYGLGILYRSRLERHVRKIPSFWYFAFLFAVKLAIAYHYGKMPKYNPSWCRDFTEGPLMPIVTGVLGIALWMRIAEILEPVIGRSRWINLLAVNTYSIMMNHFLGFMALKTVFALMCKWTGLFADFDFVSYRTNIWWCYLPKGLEYMLTLYGAAGIAFSIAVQAGINFVKRHILYGRDGEGRRTPA